MAGAIKKKITPKDMNPKRLLGQDAATRSFSLGRLLGVASGVTKATSQTGDVMEGLTGQFKYMDFTAVDPQTKIMEEYNSGILWLPSGFGLDIIAALKKEDTSAIRFAFDVGVVRAENPAGYEWTMTPLIAPTEDNPLAILLADVSKTAPSQITGGAGGAAQLTDQTKTEGGDETKTDAPAETEKVKGKK